MIQVDRLELELKSRDEHIEKLRNHLNLARTNKEYSALLTELNTAKADDSKLETQVLELMRNVETDTAECAEIKTTNRSEQKTKLEESGEPKSRTAKASILKRKSPKCRPNGMLAAKGIPARMH